MKTCHNIQDVPADAHFVALTFTSVTTPGDERSRTHPGHGYPESTDYYAVYNVFESEAEMQTWCVREALSTRYASTPFRLLRVQPLTVEHTVRVNPDPPAPDPRIGQEYYLLHQFATLVAIEGGEAVMLNRWDQHFRVDLGDLPDKPMAKSGD